MKKLIFTLSLLTITVLLTAQIKISGVVKDNRGRPLIGASVSLKNSYDGTITDSLGMFNFKTMEKGDFTLSVTNIGFFDFEQAIKIDKDPIQIQAALKEKLDELKAVTVTAGSFEASDKKRAATVLTSIDVATTAGSNADISAALKTLPGAQQVGEQEGLFVRGGAGYETKQFIDGTVVNNPYYSSASDIASRGRFSPFLFKGTVFSTGGYSALYGQALSSALILESIDLPEKSTANAFISPLTWGAGYQNLSKDKKSSWGINYGYVNVGIYFNLVKQTPDYFKIPQFHNGDVNFRFKTKNGGIVKYYSTYSYGNFGLRRPDIDSSAIKDAFGLTNHNWYNNLSWRENIGHGWKMNLALSYSTNKDDISQQIQDASNTPLNTGVYYLDSKNFILGRRQDLSQVRAVFDKKISGISVIRFGTEYWYNFDKSDFNGYSNILKDNYNAVFAESDIYVTNDLAAKIGGRFEYSSIIKKANFAPRVSLAYKTGKNAQVSASYGIFYQKPENNQLVFSNNLGYTKATHYLINYLKSTNDKIFRIEAFYKKYNDLIKTFPDTNNNGGGFAKGIEFFWRDKKTFKNFDYWISYSYLDTKRDYLNYPQELQPNFAANHTVSVVTKRFFMDIKTGFNFTYTYATGRPYYNFMLNNGKYEIADQGKTKAFHTLGFSANYVPSIGKTNAKTFWVLFASVNNVLGYNPVYNYNYSYNGLIKEAVTNPAKRFYFIGVFLSWGVDRTQDAINNNL